MKSHLLKIVLAVVALGGAVWVIVGQVNAPAPGELSFFYDLSEGRIYKASKDSLLPHPGIGGSEGDGFRAFVIAPKGEAENPKSQKVAYLESYTPDFAAKIAAFNASLKDESAPKVSLSREETWKGTLVRRPNEEKWHEQSSPEGEEIRREWMNPGADGRPWVVCEPR